MSSDAKQAVWSEEDIRDLDRLCQKIASGASINHAMHPDTDLLPLGMAARLGSVEACRLLLEAGANPNVARFSRLHPSCPLLEVIDARMESVVARTPVMPVGVMKEVFEVLVAFGADPNGYQRGEFLQSRESTLNRAATYYDHAAIRALVELGADLDKKIAYLRENGLIMSTVEHVPVLDEMKHSGKSDDGRPVGDEDTMLLLLRLGADDSCLGNPNRDLTPFTESVSVGRDKLVEYYVLERGEDLAQQVNGKTLLQMAVAESTRVVLKSLKTELAVKDAIGTQGSGTQTVARPKRREGLTLL
jgi:ankyrin repeat protein